MSEDDNVTLVCPRCERINRASCGKLAAGLRSDCGGCGTPLFSGPLDLATDEAFERQIARTSIPVLVDFWAEWCGPCKMMAPHFAAASKHLEPRIRLIKVDTEKLRATASRFAIKSIPTLVLIRNGKEIARQAGALDANAIERWVASHGAP
jgi:thioredoxin 2